MNVSKSNFLGLFLLGLSLAVGISIGGYFIGQTMYNAKVALNTAEAKGLAEREVQADRAEWRVSFSATGRTRADVPNLYTQAEGTQQVIIDLLKASGFTDNEIATDALSYSFREFRNNEQIVTDQDHTISGAVSVSTDKVRLVGAARAKMSRLIADGHNILSGQPIYRFTRLNEIKPEMLREATKNARLAANEFAANAGVKVGGIRSARQGGFNIRDAGEEYGDTRKIDKMVRVVTTIDFYLEK
ncbi:MAG: SIMPL domain-containing protein [Candidatus Omnitrophica bacterium]|nr:SIMPL domain-containing protein [Candidatus Omnitrophota bacterium]MCB9719340.1 SIMPL domain-containing protein [Candidatus Omnitrophota bacterium]